VRADAASVGAGYQPGAVRALDSLLAGLSGLSSIRAAVSSADVPASQVIRIYTGNIIGPATTFSAAAGGAASDARLQGTVTTLAALLRVENDQSVQRAILYAALSAHPPVLAPEDLSSLQQTAGQEVSDLAAFNASASPAEQRLFASTVAGPAVDVAAAEEILAAASPRAPLTTNTGLDAAAWYDNMSITIGDTRKVTSQLAGQVIGQADALRSNAATSLLLTGIAMLILLLVLLITAVLARPLRT